MNKSHLLSVAVLVVSAVSGGARTWQEAGSDRTIDGDYNRTEDGKAVIIRANGTSVKVPLSRLRDEDQKIIAELMAAKTATATNVYRWETDIDVAKKRAKDEKKPMLLDFTGSDWCGWCMKLKKEVFDTPEFQQYAKDKLVLVEVDFPHGRKLPKDEAQQNEKLAKEYSVGGFPTVILLNSKGSKVGQTGYHDGGPEKYIEHLKGLLK